MDGSCKPIGGKQEWAEGFERSQSPWADRQEDVLRWDTAPCLMVGRGANQQGYLVRRDQAQGSNKSQPLKPLPEMYRPECKSWCASNSSWHLSSALYARMVQSPWREEDKWENTGLRAAERQIDTKQRKLSEARCKESNCLLCSSSVLPHSKLRAS
jgi:hypothetical protein